MLSDSTGPLHVKDDKKIGDGIMAILFPLKIQEDRIEDSRFRLAQLTSQRAKMLIRGRKPLIDSAYKKPITIALEEIYMGKISPYDAEEAEKIRNELEKRVRDKEEAEVKTIKEKENARKNASKEDKDE
jgi:DNA-directed RNA polymerase subunit omega